MAKSKDISFKVTLTKGEWDKDINGWRCPVFKIPGAVIGGIYDRGKQLGPDDYEIDPDLEMIRWRSNNTIPNSLAVLVKLTKNLSTQETTNSWRFLAGVFGTIAIASATLLSNSFGELTKKILGSKDYVNGVSIETTVSPTLNPTPEPASSATPEADSFTSTPLTSASLDKPTPSAPDSMSVTTSTSTPIPMNKYKEQYRKGEYPVDRCGEVIGTPVYPIFIPSSPENYEKVKREFCGDASYAGGKIQIASFSDPTEADMFLEFIKEHFNAAWKGIPEP